MSSMPNQPRTEVSRDVQLIVKIIQKTQIGRITWHRLPSSVSAITPNGMQFDFIINSPILLPSAGPIWVSFTVRDQNVEVFKIQRPILRPVPGSAPFALLQAVDALFNEATGRAEDHVGRAIAKVDQL